MTSIAAHADIVTSAQPPIDAARIRCRVETLAAMTLADATRVLQPHHVVATIGRIAMMPNVPSAAPGFIPCLNGRSHCAEESIAPAHLLDGARVLYETISTLDTTLAATRR